jgi:hypothetical protein
MIKRVDMFLVKFSYAKYHENMFSSDIPDDEHTDWATLIELYTVSEKLDAHDKRKLKLEKTVISHSTFDSFRSVGHITWYKQAL